MPAKRSRIHPRYKTKYRVTNWNSYAVRLACSILIRMLALGRPASVAMGVLNPADENLPHLSLLPLLLFSVSFFLLVASHVSFA